MIAWADLPVLVAVEDVQLQGETSFCDNAFFVISGAGFTRLVPGGWRRHISRLQPNLQPRNPPRHTSQQRPHVLNDERCWPGGLSELLMTCQDHNRIQPLDLWPSFVRHLSRCTFATGNPNLNPLDLKFHMLGLPISKPQHTVQLHVLNGEKYKEVCPKNELPTTEHVLSGPMYCVRAMNGAIFDARVKVRFVQVTYAAYPRVASCIFGWEIW